MQNAGHFFVTVHSRFLFIKSSYFLYATVGTFVQKIHESAFVLMIIGFVLAFLFGPVFYGGIRQLAYLESHTIPNPAAASDSLEAAPASATESAPEAGATPGAATSEATTERLVKGKTTFKEVLGWGLSQKSSSR